MSENIFIPKIGQRPQPEAVEADSQIEESGKDQIGGALLKIAQYLIVLLFGLTPIFFTVKTWSSLDFDKTLLALTIGVIALTLAGLFSLRQKQISTPLFLTYGLFLTFVLAVFASAVISGDTQDAIRGSVMETQTAGFIAVLGLLMILPLIFKDSKLMTIRALAAFGLAITVLLVYLTLRMVLGPDFLTFDTFNVITASPFGTFNDIALLAGLVVMLSLITLAQLPIRLPIQLMIAGLVVMSLFVLSVINFFNIWVLVGFFALLILVYQITRDSLFGSRTKTDGTRYLVLLATAALVCVVSAVFIIAGDYVGQKISRLTNVNYVEVRPSFEATLGIAKQVYENNAMFGVGANRFADAWRMYKDQSINNTLFWDTDFYAGSGYVPAIFVTTGLLGGILLVAFHLGLLYLGYRMLIKTEKYDSYWYYLGVVSLTASAFIWLMSYLYVPGTAILLLGALFTGLVFVSAGALLPSIAKNVPLVTSRQRGFLVMSLVIVLIVASVGILFSVSKQYLAEAGFAKAQVMAKSIGEFDVRTQDAYRLYPDDRFMAARARVYLTKLNSLLTVEKPTEEQQREVISAAEKALTSIQQAVQDDPTDPDNYMITAGVYSALAVLAGTNNEQRKVAEERAVAALDRAKELDPKNPGYHLLGAQMYTRLGNREQARSELSKALELKPNFTQALYLSAQLDIADGKVDSAVATTKSIIALEPNNPTRYFQLGVLLASQGDYEEAVLAYKAALGINPQYANARYMLALSLLDLKQPQAALEQLRIVEKTNPDNKELKALIEKVEAGDYEIPKTPTVETPLTENSPTPENVGENINQVNSDLIKPVNTTPETSKNKPVYETVRPEQNNKTDTTSAQ